MESINSEQASLVLRAENSSDQARPAMPMMMASARGLSKIARLGRLAMDVMKLLAVPILVLITDFFLETIGFGAESALTAPNARVGLVLFVLSLPIPVVHVVNEVKRIRRLRSLTDHVEPSLTLGELRELRLCRGSGRSALKVRHWGKDRCQHCFASPDVVGNRIKDHLIPRVYIGIMPVECDPRLVAILNR